MSNYKTDINYVYYDNDAKDIRFNNNNFDNKYYDLYLKRLRNKIFNVYKVCFINFGFFIILETLIYVIVSKCYCR